MSIVVIGEALVDIVEQPGRKPSTTPGGSPLNVAVGLGRLGHAVELHAGVADDPNGAVILNHLDASGVSLRNDMPPVRSASAVATIQDDGSARYEFDVDWQVASVEVSPATRFVHTGSLGAALPPGDATALEAMRASRAHAITTFDPNVRPALMRPHAQQLPVTEMFFSAADVVKLSDEDAAWLYPGWALDRVADRLLALGAAVVAVTRGADGALVCTGAHRIALATQVPGVVDTIGAGDSFMAGMIHALSEIFEDVELPVVDRGQMLDLQALSRVGSFAQSCAAVTVSRRGADLPWATELLVSR
ncbi:carbohydrate kinase family protein [Microbacterium sp. bgisy189]|uniref:carbohydrate kinase family protein n=1 Tax=Microbacterium sp. bgisy189 TaxID=3413798 RepID=UPI003EC07799